MNLCHFARQGIALHQNQLDGAGPADFTYVRWLGDRKAIEQTTKVWNKVVVDRSLELTEWSEVLGKLKIPIYVHSIDNRQVQRSPASRNVAFAPQPFIYFTKSADDR